MDEAQWKKARTQWLKKWSDAATKLKQPQWLSAHIIVGMLKTHETKEAFDVITTNVTDGKLALAFAFLAKVDDIGGTKNSIERYEGFTKWLFETYKDEKPQPK